SPPRYTARDPRLTASRSLRGDGSRRNDGPMERARVPDNYLLELLSADVRGSLGLMPVQLHARQVLYEPGVPVLNAYFPVSAVISAREGQRVRRAVDPGGRPVGIGAHGVRMLCRLAPGV